MTATAFESGAGVAALQASPMGLPVYAAMGYQVISTDRLWFAPAGGLGG